MTGLIANIIGKENVIKIFLVGEFFDNLVIAT